MSCECFVSRARARLPARPPSGGRRLRVFFCAVLLFAMVEAECLRDCELFFMMLCVCVPERALRADK